MSKRFRVQEIRRAKPNPAELSEATRSVLSAAADVQARTAPGQCGGKARRWLKRIFREMNCYRSSVQQSKMVCGRCAIVP